ncbi:transmembrane protein 211-like [Labeo rohita]|uniref:Transmembrane protein 211-like n=1 Tax=Labeo rohita TaxID=84645 RepID=A0A498N141_LABRO|nr:transmembrane protein 211-like [Labeo rohita]
MLLHYSLNLIIKSFVTKAHFASGLQQRPQVALVIMGSGLLVYPFGLNSNLVKSFCGDSDIYYAGECQIGWGYMLAIVGVMLTLFLPFFAKYAPKEHLSPTPLPTLL